MGRCGDGMGSEMSTPLSTTHPVRMSAVMTEGILPPPESKKVLDGR